MPKLQKEGKEAIRSELKLITDALTLTLINKLFADSQTSHVLSGYRKMRTIISRIIAVILFSNICVFSFGGSAYADDFFSLARYVPSCQAISLPTFDDIQLICLQTFSAKANCVLCEIYRPEKTSNGRSEPERALQTSHSQPQNGVKMHLNAF